MCLLTRDVLRGKGKYMRVCVNVHLCKCVSECVYVCTSLQLTLKSTYQLTCGECYTGCVGLWIVTRLCVAALVLQVLVMVV